MRSRDAGGKSGLGAHDSADGVGGSGSGALRPEEPMKEADSLHNKKTDALAPEAVYGTGYRSRGGNPAGRFEDREDRGPRKEPGGSYRGKPEGVHRDRPGYGERPDKDRPADRDRPDRPDRPDRGGYRGAERRGDRPGVACAHQYGTNTGFAADRTDDKFASKFGDDEEWGKVKKLTNSKKADAPLPREEPEKKPPAPRDPEPKQLKPTRYIDSNNKFSILHND